MTDDVSQAVALWHEGSDKRFEFAIKCYSVVGKRDGSTARLVRELKNHVGVDTIEDYAKGGQLWVAMVMHYPSEAEYLRDELYISFWNTVGRRYVSKLKAKVKELVESKLPQSEIESETFRLGKEYLDEAKHWLEEAAVNEWTVEILRSKLPVNTTRATFANSAVKLADYIEKSIIHAPAEYKAVDDRLYVRIARVARLFVGLLRKVKK